MSEWKESLLKKLPQDWRLLPVLQLQEAGILLVEDGNHGNDRPLLQEFGSKGIAFVRAGDIDNNTILFEKTEKINDIAFRRIRKGKGQNGDTIISHKGTVGTVAYVPASNTQPFICSPQTTFYRSLNENILQKEFIFLYLLSPLFQEQFDTVSGESDMAPYVSLTSQRGLYFLLPPIDKQRQIVSVLFPLIEKISLLTNQNKTLNQLAEMLFRQWIIIDENNWEEKSLDEIAEFLNGLACQKFPPKQDEIGLPVVKIKEMRTGITEASDYSTADVPEKYLIQNGDMLFSWSGSLDIVLWFGGKAVLNQHLFKVSSLDYPQWFYYFWTQFHLPEFKGIANDKATTMGHIQRHHLSDAKVITPPDEEIRRMDQTINPIFHKIKSNITQIKTLQHLRDTLLPKLISGEVRIEK